MNDDRVTEYLEPQPHGGALKRSELTPTPAEQSPSEARQGARIAGIPDFYKTKHERMACELALKMEDAEAIFRAYDYTPEQAAELCESQAFVTLLERVTKEIQSSGLTFKAKAKAIAEDSLPYAYEMLSDPNCSAAVRLGTIQWVAKMAGHDVPPKDDAKVGGGFTLSIQFSGAAPTQIIAGNQSQDSLSTREPLTIENGQ